MGQRTERIYNRGESFLRKKNYEQALRLFNQVLNREPGHKKALKNKVIIKIDQDKNQEAEEFLEFALKQVPDDSELQQIAGSYYMSLNKADTAEKHFKKSIVLDDKNALAHYGLGLIAANQHSDHEESIRCFSHAIQLENNFANAHFNRGCSYMLQDQMVKAREDFLKAKELEHPEADHFLQQYF